MNQCLLGVRYVVYLGAVVCLHIMRFMSLWNDVVCWWWYLLMMFMMMTLLLFNTCWLPGY